MSSRRIQPNLGLCRWKQLLEITFMLHQKKWEAIYDGRWVFFLIVCPTSGHTFYHVSNVAEITQIAHNQSNHMFINGFRGKHENQMAR